MDIAVKMSKKYAAEKKRSENNDRMNCGEYLYICALEGITENELYHKLYDKLTEHKRKDFT